MSGAGEQARQEAERAAKAAMDALHGVGSGAGLGDGHLPHTGQEMLHDAKQSVDHALDDLLHSGAQDNPAAHRAVADARKAVDAALKDLQAGGDPTTALSKAQHAVDKAFQGLLGGAAGDPGRQQALHSAQHAVDEALRQLNPGGDGRFPGMSPASLPDGGNGPDFDRARREAQAAVDGLAKIGADADPSDGKGSALASFLSGGHGGGGGGHGGGGGGGRVPRFGGVPGLDGLGKTPDELAANAHEKGFQAPDTARGSQTTPRTPGGLPVGEMGAGGPMMPPMGGGAGMGGSPQKNERERTVWLQGDGKDWQEDDDDTCAGPSTLGRS